MKLDVSQFGLRFRFPYITHTPLAFLMTCAGMSINDIARVTGIDRRTLIKYQLNQKPPPKKHNRLLLRAMRQIIQYAEQSQEFGGRTESDQLYHIYLDALSTWGRAVIRTERQRDLAT